MFFFIQERAVPSEDAKKFASNEKLSYFETSAKTGEGVDEGVLHLVKECLKKQKASEG